MRMLKLVLAAGALVFSGACGARPGGPVEHYGPSPLQVGQWFLPSEGPSPVVVLVHGGCYQPLYDRHLEDALATRLASEGFAVWNIDYRSPAKAQYPATFDDVVAAIDFLPLSSQLPRLDLTRVAFVGHSAGGQLVLWAGSEPTNGPRQPTLRPSLVVAQAPLADLTFSSTRSVCGNAVSQLLGGAPERQAERYRAADPVELTPSAPVVLIHGLDDSLVPVEESRRYHARHLASRLVQVPGDHFVHLDNAGVATDRLLEALSVLKP